MVSTMLRRLRQPKDAAIEKAAAVVRGGLGCFCDCLCSGKDGLRGHAATSTELS